MKVAIQGVKGSNHHIVVQHYFDQDIELDECLSLNDGECLNNIPLQCANHYCLLRHN